MDIDLIFVFENVKFIQYSLVHIGVVYCFYKNIYPKQKNGEVKARRTHFQMSRIDENSVNVFQINERCKYLE